MYEGYAKIINIEAKTMIDMARREILPAVTAYTAEVASAASAKRALIPTADISAEADTVTRLSTLTGRAHALLAALQDADDKAKTESTPADMARAFRDLVIPVMNELRGVVDQMETLTAASAWPMADYGDMLFSI